MPKEPLASTTLNNSFPSISHSTFTNCTLNNLTPADSIRRSTLNQVTLTRVSTNKEIPTSLRRNDVKNCLLTNTKAHRCTLSNSILTNIESIRRSTVHKSTITDHSVLKRSTVKDSYIETKSSVRRSTVNHARVSNSRLKRSTLNNCEVSECVIQNSSFSGMRLRFGVWKNGKLVGRIGNGEVVAVGIDKPIPSQIRWDVPVVTHDAKFLRDNADSEGEDDSGCESEGEKPDLPPPYAA